MGLEIMKDDAGKKTDSNDTSENKIKRYVLIELSCDVTACDPCVYPDCQRYRRNENLFGKGQKRPKITKITEVSENGTVKA